MGKTTRLSGIIADDGASASDLKRGNVVADVVLERMPGTPVGSSIAPIDDASSHDLRLSLYLTASSCGM